MTENSISGINTYEIEDFDTNDLLMKYNEKKENDQNTVTQCQIYLFMLLLLLSGAINTIINKLQQEVVSLGVKFKGHQKFITFCMCVGEFLCLGIYYLKECSFKRKKIPISLLGDTKKEAKTWYFILPAFFDILGSSLSTIGLTFLPSSIYQMFRGAIIIFTFIASIVFLKTKFFKHHFLGIIIVIIGLIIVGINSINLSNNSRNRYTQKLHNIWNNTSYFRSIFL